MKHLNHIVAIALMASMTTSAYAQDFTKEELFPNGFIGVQAGGQYLLGNDLNVNSGISPKVGFQLGSWFVPEMGIRLSLNGASNKVKLENGELDYKFKTITSDIDLLFSLSNILFPNRFSQRWNTYLVAGVGANSNWDVTSNTITPEYNDFKETLSRYWVNNRVGLGVEYGLSNAWALNLEVDYNIKNNNICFLTDNKSIKDVSAMIGVNFRFGGHHKKAKSEDMYAPVTSQVDYEAEAAARAKAEAEAAKAAQAKAIEARRLAEAEATAKIAKAKADRLAAPLEDISLHYDRCGVDIKSADKEALEYVTEWAKANSSKRIIVNGYADRGTGNPSINMKYSRMRANNVADALKNAGVPADQIVVKAWGDKVQPYKENDKNRCVILLEK